MNKFGQLTSAALLSAAVSTTAVADEKNSPSALENDLLDTSKTVSLIIKGDNVGLGFRTDNWFYLQGTTDFDDEKSIWAAYSIDNLTIGWAYADKSNVGNQKTIGWAYNFEVTDKTYINTAAKYTRFDANSAYADSDAFNFRASVGTELMDNLYWTVWAWYKTFKSDDYDRENSATANVWATYCGDWFSVNVWYEKDKFSNNVMATLNIPLGKGSSKSCNINNIAQYENEKFLADSTFDNSIVKVRKTPVVNTPANPADTEAPQLTSTSNSYNALLDNTNTKTFDYSSIVSDNISTDAETTLEVVSAPWLDVSVSGLSVTLTRNTWDAGDNTAVLRFRDKAGNVSWNFTQTILWLDDN